MEVHKASLAMLLVASICSSCASTGTHERAAEEAKAQVVQDPGAWASEGRAGEVQVGWLESFDDPTLLQLVEEAQAHNKDLQATAANVDRARALAVQAGAALGPSVGLSAGGSRSGDAAGGDRSTALNVGVEMSWEIDLWGRIRAGARAATASVEATEADFRFAQYSLAAGVAKAYFVAIEAGHQQGVSEQTVADLEETLRIVELRYENGMVSSQDVALARSDLASARERLVTVQGSRRDALRGLEILLGRYPKAELEVAKVLPPVPSLPPVGLPSQILERRPDLIAAERRVASAFDAVDQARAARLPSISLTGGIGGASNALSTLLDPANLAWSAGTSLLAPLFDGGARRAQVEVATADQEQALAAYGQAALEAFRDVETSLDSGTVLAQRRKELAVALKEAEEAFRVVELRYKEGATDLLEVLSVQQRVFSAETNLVSLHRQSLTQRVDLHLALGGDWEKE